MARIVIDSYQFGEVTINGKKYTSDVIISHNGVKEGWWRKKGHQLCIEDLTELLHEGIEVLIIGTGSHGGLIIPTEVRQYVEGQGIKIIAETTEKACLTFNELLPSKKVVAALHLTC